MGGNVADLIIGPNESCCRIETWRDSHGLRVHAKAHPAVEEFMKGLGNGAVDPVEAYAKLWTPVAGTDPLMIYNGKEYLFRGSNYRLDMPGRNLVIDGETVNLSFLRIQGISKGVKFCIRGVHSFDGLVDFNKRLQDSMDDLYRNFLKPVNMWVEVITNPY
jgi:hypothetical protein